MITRIHTGSLAGVDAVPVEVEVNISQGLPNVFVIGLPDVAVRESRLRVENALRTLGLKMPARRVTISLAPGDLRKSGSSYDLPMAVGLLAAMGVVPPDSTNGRLFVGELALDGSLRPIRGALAFTLLAHELGRPSVVVPFDNATEAGLLEGPRVEAARTLADVVQLLCGERDSLPAPTAARAATARELPELEDVRGLALAKRALLIAAAGGHHLLFTGPPGTGKTMLARRLPGLLPPLSPNERLEVTKVHSAAGLLHEGGLALERPFRAPHHTVSRTALVGGGHGGRLRVGEVSLAHLGVLFLDEAAEMARGVLDSLREPLERGEVRIARTDARLTLPAFAQLALALNPCPCGHGWEGSRRECRCPPGAAERYQARLSGPLLDRVDLQIPVDPIPIDVLQGPPTGPSSAELRARVLAARDRQLGRLRTSARPPLNGWMSRRDAQRTCTLEREAGRLLHAGAERLALSARGVDRVLRVARTIADLDGAPRIRSTDVGEALTFRLFEQPVSPPSLSTNHRRATR